MRWLMSLIAFVGVSTLVVVGEAPQGGLEWKDRFVWLFRFRLNTESDLGEIIELLDTAGRLGYNGAVGALGFDTLCKRNERYFDLLGRLKQAARQRGVELVPSIFSVGYGGAILAHNPHLAEGFPVKDALFRVLDEQTAVYVPDSGANIVNGSFEEYEGNRARGYRFHDQPGVVSFIDTSVAHSGRASLRFENFRANPHGHGRVMQEVTVKPYRCYRVSVWVKTESLQPASAFALHALTEDRALAPQRFRIPETTDWVRLSFIFNSLNYERVRLYAGVWGARDGKFWIDDWAIEETGPINVLHRPGTPVTVRSANGAQVYEEGRDYAPLVDERFSLYRTDHRPAVLKLLPGSRIRPGTELRITWYHAMPINGSQVTVCMAEPELYEIFDHEARLLAEKLGPKKVLLSMDEIRMGGTCAACAGKDMARLLGECITRQVKILRRYMPDTEIYIWSDMLDPAHNARDRYYLVQGSFHGSWRYVPEDLIIAVWGGDPRPASVQHFARLGFPMLFACYYDQPDLEGVRGWLELARAQERRLVRGFMYTTWEKNYSLLGDFARLVWGGDGR